MSKITWQNLYNKVKICKDKDHDTFTKFSEIDECLNDIKLLIKYTPDSDKDMAILKESAELSYSRISILKGSKLKDKTGDLADVNEATIFKEVFTYRMNHKLEQKSWDKYESTLVESKENINKNNDNLSTGIAFYPISMVLILFFIVYLLNLFLSGRFEKKRLIYKLKNLNLMGYAEIVQKEVSGEETYDKKRARKKGFLDELTTSEKLMLERIYKIQEKISHTYTMKQMIKNTDEDKKEELIKKIDYNIENIQNYVERS
jgi:hypothetical protein